jgi:polar amino acid transport system substrate-binding protein
MRKRPQSGALILLAVALLVTQASLAGAPVRIGMNRGIQPFVMAESNSGLEVEIVRAAFAAESVPIEFSYISNARSWAEFESGKIDIISNAKPGSSAKAVLTHWPVLSFQNRAISLKSRHLRLGSIGDLRNLRVIAFQTASKVLGDEFADMATRNPQYSEDTGVPSFKLVLGGADVIVSQADVFRYYLRESNKRLPLQSQAEQFDYHDILGRGNDYWFAFRTELMRDQFERGISAIYQSGEIERIFARYEQRYGTTRDMFIHLDCRFKSKNKPVVCAPEKVR